MIFEAFEDKLFTPDWRVEASEPENEGDIYVTLFSGPNAKDRAEEYAAWKNASAVPNMPMRVEQNQLQHQ